MNAADMNAAEKINRIAELSPKNMARLAGVFFLLTILGGIFAQGFVSQSLVVNGDAAATAANILNNESLFWLGFAVYLIEMGCQITMTALFYEFVQAGQQKPVEAFGVVQPDRLRH